MMLFSFEFMVYFFVGTTMLSMIRIIIGPSPVDRLIGLNLVAAQVLAILVLIAVKENLTVYLDVALVYDIFGFVGMLAITKYCGRKEGTQ
ncbi:pH regulation protein F [candidate division KSB3 bacterium]|uniref:PH regulation protein F n=1 Tax=candidate division KSB3 bacterium TaxID=2044937 RepID=A0A9D5JS33_9BACT|nr:pH regulation protein F [candidate division KSB3 bacterium]MBD3323237.1 pH regulation protein F [candidate division KSB3 bacterium]